jgi:HEAT repeat protein
MRKRIQLLFAVLFALTTVVSPTSLPAQDEEEPLSVEELYLSSEITLSTLAVQMQSPGRDVQLLALDTLKSQLERGTIDSEDEAVLEALEPLVQQGVIESFEDNRWGIDSYDPVVRREAVNVVAQLGTDAARSVLVRTVRHDPEPIVRAAALFGLSRLGVDPDGSVSRAIAKMMLQEHLQQFDEGVMYAALVALNSIASEPDNVVDTSAMEMLVTVASDGRYSRSFRELALETLAYR